MRTNDRMPNIKNCMHYKQWGNVLEPVYCYSMLHLPGMLAELEPDLMLEVEREDQSYAASVLFIASW